MLSYPVQTQVSVWIKPDALPLQHCCFIAILQCHVKNFRIQTQPSPETTFNWKELRRAASTVSEKLAWHPTHFGLSYRILHCSPGFMKLFFFFRKHTCMHIWELKHCEREVDMPQYKSSLTSVLNTPTTVYQPFYVLITEKQWNMDFDWLVRNAQWDANRNGRNVCRIAAETVDGSGSICLAISATQCAEIL